MNLDNKLTDAHSKYIRLKATNENGYGNCKCCNNPITYWNSACGHFIKSRHKRFKWEEINTDCICGDCNSIEESDSLAEPMRDYKVSTLGFEQVEKMERQVHQDFKMCKWDKEQLLSIRKKQIKVLLEYKNFTI